MPADQPTLARRLAGLCEDLFLQAGFHVSMPVDPIDYARLLGCDAQLCKLAVAERLRMELLKSADGREALRNLGFEPVLEHIEGE